MVRWICDEVDFTILTLIGSNADVTLKTLAEALGIAPSNLTVIVDRSVARNLVVREPSEDDRRSRHLRLTASGRDLLDKAWEVARHMESAPAGAVFCGRARHAVRAARPGGAAQDER